MQKHVNLVDLVKSFPTNIYLKNLASIQKRTSPVKFAHLAEKSGKGSISNLSTKVHGARVVHGRAEADLGAGGGREPHAGLRGARPGGKGGGGTVVAIGAGIAAIGTGRTALRFMNTEEVVPKNVDEDLRPIRGYGLFMASDA